MPLRLSFCFLACVAVGCGDAPVDSTSTVQDTNAPGSSASEETQAETTGEPKIETPPNEAAAASDPSGDNKMTGPLSFEMETLTGEKVALSKYQGKVVLFVNVASACGLTPQYEKLQALHEQYAGKGLAIVGVPCNQFGKQEPGSPEEIQAFCSENYGVEFDMMAKVEVNGDGACDLYKYLTALDTEPQGAGNIGWNFEKFLIDRSGAVINRFAPRTTPDDPQIVGAIEAALTATP